MSTSVEAVPPAAPLAQAHAATLLRHREDPRVRARGNVAIQSRAAVLHPWDRVLPGPGQGVAMTTSMRGACVGMAGASRDFFIWTARNPLKCPELDERIQGNPSLFSWSGLDWLRFGLDEFGPRRYGVGRLLRVDEARRRGRSEIRVGEVTIGEPSSSCWVVAPTTRSGPSSRTHLSSAIAPRSTRSDGSCKRRITDGALRAPKAAYAHELRQTR